MQCLQSLRFPHSTSIQVQIAIIWDNKKQAVRIKTNSLFICVIIYFLCNNYFSLTLTGVRLRKKNITKETLLITAHIIHAVR